MIDPLGLLFGFAAGEGYGESAAMYYADITNDPCASGLAKTGAWAGGLFASLWTPSTSNKTALTLTAGLAADLALIRFAPNWAHYAHARVHKIPHLQFGNKRINAPKKVIDSLRKDQSKTIKRFIKRVRWHLNNR